jgi:hypothetical protein
MVLSWWVHAGLLVQPTMPVSLQGASWELCSSCHCIGVDWAAELAASVILPLLRLSEVQ